MNKKRILVIGGSGFIGRNIVESELFKKYEVIAPTSKQLDLSNLRSIEEFFIMNSFDIVIHAASKSGKLNTSDKNNIYFENKDICYENLKMFFNIVDFQHCCKKLIYINSGSMYNKEFPIDNVSEDDLINAPQDEHGLSRYIIANYIEDCLLDVIDLRLFGIYGKYENSMRVPTSFINKCIKGEPITINKNRVMSYLYIDDLICILDYFINNNEGYKSYNITPDEKIYTYDIACLAKSITGSNSNILTMSCDYEYTGNNRRLKDEVSIEFTSMRDGMEKLYKYLKEEKTNV